MCTLWPAADGRLASLPAVICRINRPSIATGLGQAALADGTCARNSQIQKCDGRFESGRVPQLRLAFEGIDDSLSS
jgi:hypothetical protein